MEKNEMNYIKMIYTLDYDTKKDKSKRALLRAYQKSGITELIENDCPFVLCFALDGKMYDFVTQREIVANGQKYEIVSREEIGKIIETMGYEKYKKLYSIMCVMFFDDKQDLGFEITTMDEMTGDRRKQFEAYLDERNLTDIDPYGRETLNNYTTAAVKRYNKR